jgi:hypothetical protein
MHVYTHFRAPYEHDKKKNKKIKKNIGENKKEY